MTEKLLTPVSPRPEQTAHNGELFRWWRDSDDNLILQLIKQVPATAWPVPHPRFHRNWFWWINVRQKKKKNDIVPLKAETEDAKAFNKPEAHIYPDKCKGGWRRSFIRGDYLSLIYCAPWNTF